MHYQRCWMNDNYVKFEFEIQFLHIYYEFNGDNLFTVNIYKIYFNYNSMHPNNKLHVLQTSVQWISKELKKKKKKKKILNYFQKKKRKNHVNYKNTPNSN